MREAPIVIIIVRFTTDEEYGLLFPMKASKHEIITSPAEALFRLATPHRLGYVSQHGWLHRAHGQRQSTPFLLETALPHHVKPTPTLQNANLSASRFEDAAYLDSH